MPRPAFGLSLVSKEPYRYAVLNNESALISWFIKDIPQMPEKSGKAHIEADCIFCACLGVDVFKIIFTAIMLLLLLLLNRHNDFDGVQEVEVTGACGVPLCRGKNSTAHSHLCNSSL